MPWAAGTLLEQLPNGGAVVAVIAVVVVFLRRQERSEDALAAIVAAFTAEARAARQDYREHVSGIMDQGLAAHRETRDAIRSLDDTLGKLGKAESPARRGDPKS